MERITIIGTSPVGVSMGLALKTAKLKNTEVVGSSGDKQALSAAAKMGAYDKTETLLRSAVEGAQLIVLDIPFTEMREMLEAIGPIIENDCVITDTCSTKTKVIDWAENFLPKGVSFVGGHPLIKREHGSLDDAVATLFQGIEYCVMPGATADQQSVKTVIGFIELMHANPLFLDPHEHDSYTTAMDLLPIVMSSAFTSTVAKSESWREMHKLTGDKFAQHASLSSSDPLDNEAACLANAETMVHWIDKYITELYEFRNMIKDGSEDLVQAFIKSWEEHGKWQANAVTGKHENPLPSSRESMATAFFGERLSKRYSLLSGGEKKDSWVYRR
ncbi:MAG: prephenate dehydrogenase [Chloroflexi bacterium]|nr:prephenate dehydrogenase [Chloroflexota bacterium]MDA1228654.1 prephenate dehydrogenase [Chloroflexota bacterium]